MKNLRLYGLAVAIAALILDQITKIAVLAAIHDPVEILPFFNLVLVWNKGVSFGLFGQEGDGGRYMLIGFSLLITACMAVWLWRVKKLSLALAIGAVIGGAVGNIIDRVRLGAVVDFLDFHAMGWHWPAFNVADCCIVLGIAFIVVDGLFFDHQDTKTPQKQNDIAHEA